MEEEITLSTGQGITSESSLVSNTAPIDTDDIRKKYKRFSLFETVLRNQLLGSYRDGRYYINDKIAKDLLKLSKHTTSSKENVLLCQGTHKDTTLRFELRYEIYTTYSTAKLYLLEKIQEVEYEDELKSIVGYEVYPADPNFLDAIKKMWNIDQPEGEEHELSDLDAALIGLVENYKFNKDLLDVLAHLYVLNMLEVLGSEDYGKEVVEQYNTRIAALATADPTIFNNYSKLKNILDEVMSEHKVMPKLMQGHAEEVSNILRSFYEPLERINPDFAKDAVAPKVTQVEGSIDEPTPVAPKKVAESSGGGKSKSASPKKVAARKVSVPKMEYGFGKSGGGSSKKMGGGGKGGKTIKESNIPFKPASASNGGKTVGTTTETPTSNEESSKNSQELYDSLRQLEIQAKDGFKNKGTEIEEMTNDINKYQKEKDNSKDSSASTDEIEIK